MGPVNWLAVIMGALLALAVGFVWYNPLFRSERPVPGTDRRRDMRAYLVRNIVALLLVSAMIGHNFARIGPETLAAKPWLYWMMSGGLGLAVMTPALMVSLGRHAVPLRERLLDCGYWIAATLAIGTTFWVLD